MIRGDERGGTASYRLRELLTMVLTALAILALIGTSGGVQV